MYIQKAEIKNIRSIIDFEIEFKNPAGWHVLIGDNGAGKSTIIRSIALVLIKEQKEGLRQDFSNWISSGKSYGGIKLEFSTSEGLENLVASNEKIHLLIKEFNWLADYSYGIDSSGNIVALNLTGSGLKDFSMLKELKNLTSLDLRLNNLSNIDFLRELQNLTSLDLSDNYHLSNYEPLKELKNLTSLNLRLNRIPPEFSKNQVTDTESLRALKNLTSLNLSQNNLSNLDFLKELKELTSLDLSYINLRNVDFISADFLKELKNLTSLNLAGNKLSNYNLLKELKNLTSLDLWNNKLSNADFLKELKNLTSLNLIGNHLTNVDFLRDLKGLTTLHLENNKLTNIDFLKELENLTSLSLGGNKLSNLSFLKELKKLTSLGLNNSNLSNADFLKELKQLTSLHLRHNNLSDVSFLKELPLLESVFLNGNDKLDKMFPKEILQGDRNASKIISYLEEKIDGNNEQNYDKRTPEISQNNKPVQKIQIFSSAFGPYRRFEGGSSEWDDVFNNPSLENLAAHLSVFDESVALTEPIKWLKDLNYKSLEGKSESKHTLENLKKLINSEDFLPHNAQLESVSSDGVFFKDGNGTIISVNQMSDGYRSILSMTFELIRQLVRVYGSEAVFKNIEKGEMFIDLPGVVLVDEIDAHLHPTWQTRIGNWFLKYFPKLQFIVTTHSPLVCRAAENGSIWRLAPPGSDEKSGEITGLDRERLIYGNILDAYGTEVFGADVSISQESVEKQEKLVRLSKKKMLGAISSAEEEKLQDLKKVFTTDAPIEL